MYLHLTLAGMCNTLDHVSQGGDNHSKCFFFAKNNNRKTTTVIMITTPEVVPMIILVTSVDVLVSGQKMEKKMSNLNESCQKKICEIQITRYNYSSKAYKRKT